MGTKGEGALHTLSIGAHTIGPFSGGTGQAAGHWLQGEEQRGGGGLVLATGRQRVRTLIFETLLEMKNNKALNGKWRAERAGKRAMKLELGELAERRRVLGERRVESREQKSGGRGVAGTLLIEHRERKCSNSMCFAGCGTLRRERERKRDGGRGAGRGGQVGQTFLKLLRALPLPLPLDFLVTCGFLRPSHVWSGVFLLLFPPPPPPPLLLWPHVAMHHPSGHWSRHLAHAKRNNWAVARPTPLASWPAHWVRLQRGPCQLPHCLIKCFCSHRHNLIS